MCTVMSHQRVWLTLGILFTLLLSLAHGQLPQTGKPTEQLLKFEDIEGKSHTLPCDKQLRGLVLVFINTECPIANSYHPLLKRLQEEFANEGFDFAMIHADPGLTMEAARKHQQEYQITWPIALDPNNNIARRVAAKVTPEAVVLDAGARVLYRGRIDDRHQDYGKKRAVASSNDLQIALQAIVKGKPVPTPETKPVGCVIRYAD